MNNFWAKAAIVLIVSANTFLGVTVALGEGHSYFSKACGIAMIALSFSTARKYDRILCGS